MDSNEVQYRARPPILVTQSGMVMEVSDVHPRKPRNQI